MPATDPIEEGEFFPYANRQRLVEERRRFPRQKAQIPAYSSFNGTSTSAQLDLNAILDISEKGIAIQASPPLEVKRPLNLRLDLSETGTNVHVTGLVVWSDRTGRAGISLPDLPEQSSRQIREWLFLNLLHASAKHFDSQQTPDASPEIRDMTETAQPAMRAEALDSLEVLDRAALRPAEEAVRCEIKSLGSDLEGALQLVASRAQTFTRSAGAAIALSEGRENEMVCRANAGTGAPPLGARLQVGAGFSGECVRTGLLLRCEDAETDLRVDRESCRQLGIRSMAAMPIQLDGRAVGLLEVFSPLPFAFTENDSQVLRRLGDAIVDALKQAGYTAPKSTSAVTTDWSQSLRAPELADSLEEDEGTPSDVSAAERGQARSSRWRVASIAAAAVLLIGALAFWGAPWVGNRIGSRTTTAAPTQKPATQPAAETKPIPAKSPAAPNTLEELRTLAERGDPNAQFALGARFATGDQVKQDYSEAVTWFSKAADQGHVVAQATLGAYYWAGRGVPQDLSQAYFWSILARAGGDEASKYRAAVLSSRMTRSQIAASQQQADAWLKQHQMAGNPSLH